MSAEKNLFKGAWAVITQESRVRGEWQRLYDFTPDDWSIGFLPDGIYGEIFRPEREMISGRWVCDDRGIISIGFDVDREFLTRRVFEGDASGGWLYIFEDAPNIPLDTDLIIAHHAYERWRLVPLIG
jgi:hypothetical protein